MPGMTFGPVMGLRLFWMTSEKFHLRRVYEAATDHLVGTDREAALAASRSRWERLEGPGSHQYTTRHPDGTETTLTNRQTADRWINGLYMHRKDEAKRKWVLALDPFSRVLMEHAFFDYRTSTPMRSSPSPCFSIRTCHRLQ